jgi:hypothetical protein
MNNKIASTHVFLYYKDTGVELINQIKDYCSGKIFLSLILNNPNNKVLIQHARKFFDLDITYVENTGSDQYGFFSSFKKDLSEKPWVFFCHDKHINKKTWMIELIEILTNVEDDYLLNKKCGMISSLKYVNKVEDINSLLNNYGSMPFEHRKNLVQSIHTVIWLKELQRILLEKHELLKEQSLYPRFCSGNIFLAKRDVIGTTHSCIYEDFFNKNVYRTDGEVSHGLERFYFYVSECLGYHNIFI